jgi:hypothetical protein
MEKPPAEPIIAVDPGREDLFGKYSVFQKSVASAAFSWYFWDSCKRAVVSREDSWTSSMFLDFASKYITDALGGIELPQGIDRKLALDKTLELIREWAEQGGLRNLVKKVKTNDLRAIHGIFKRTVTSNKQTLPQIANLFRSEEYPALLWLELSRAFTTYLEAMYFMSGRMTLWTVHRQRRNTPSGRRSTAGSLYGRVGADLLDSFLSVGQEITRILMTVDSWNSDSVDDFFRVKKIDTSRIPQVVLEERIFKLQISVNDLRHNLLTKDAISDPKTDPIVDLSYREVGQALISPLADLQ